MEPVTIYMVTDGEYSDYHTVAVFSSKELAQAYIDAVPNGGYDNHRIEEMVLDQEAGASYRDVWTAMIDLEGNAWRHSPRNEWVLVSKKVATERHTKSETHTLGVHHGGGRIFVGESAVSPEHAQKIAAECRQKWLREHSGAPESKGGA